MSEKGTKRKPLAAMVVAINRLAWRRLYNLASTRFKLES